MLLLAIFLFIANNAQLISPNITSWTTITTPFASGTNFGSIIGYNFDVNSIVIIGGDSHPQLVAAWDPVNMVLPVEQVTDASENVLVESKSYYQEYGNPTLYFIDDGSVNSSVSQINIESIISATINPEPHPKPDNSFYQVMPALCITNDLMFSIGRNVDNTATTVQELNRTSGEWTIWATDVPSTQALFKVTCEVYGTKFYLFGGENSDGIFTDAIYECDYISPTPTCTLISSLSVTRSDIESVKLGGNACTQYVVLIGGKVNDCDCPTNMVEIYDMANNELYEVVGMNENRSYTSAVYSEIDGRVWVFNGVSDSGALNSIEYTTFGDELQCTESPTVSPTRNPTQNPTQNPSQNPTVSPTRNPSGSPTRNPSASPTQDPSQSPSTEPTLDPTDYPTQEPTYGPSVSPTIEVTTTEATDVPYRPIVVDYGTPGITYAMLIIILIIICIIIAICMFCYGKEERLYSNDSAAGGAVVPILIVGCNKCGDSDCDGGCGACNKCHKTECYGSCACDKCGTNNCNGNCD